MKNNSIYQFAQPSPQLIHVDCCLVNKINCLLTSHKFQRVQLLEYICLMEFVLLCSYYLTTIRTCWWYVSIHNHTIYTNGRSSQKNNYWLIIIMVIHVLVAINALKIATDLERIFCVSAILFVIMVLFSSGCNTSNSTAISPLIPSRHCSLLILITNIEIS